MSEIAKTGCFVGAAVLSLLLAFISRPATTEYDAKQLIGEPLTESFEPEQARRLSILRFDEETATLKDFEVSEVDGIWTIPSKGGYPADAEQQMAKASTGIMDREILQIASESAAEHQAYGVIDPKSPKLEVGQTGVGARVTMYDGEDETLVDLIIGKEVKDAADQRYVRRANQDIVYIVEMTPEDLSTNFEDWIEDDLLKISPWDIGQIQIKDYTAELVLDGFTPQIQWDRRSQMKIDYDDGESKWTANDLRRFDLDSQEYVPFELGEKEELNKEKLDELKTALDDLLIVDVEKKPSGLSNDLKAGKDFLENNGSVSNLVRHGFAPVPIGDELEILSSEGEFIVTMKDGVEYVLRFGSLQLEGTESQETVEGEAATDSVNRYLFVLARLNESLIDKPELEELPELPSVDENADSDTETTDEESESEASEANDEDSEEKESEEDTASEAGNADKLAEVEAERDAIEKRNQQKRDEYDEKIATAKQRVDELNGRFGDWYYVIANDVYEKIHLSREDVVKTVDEPAADANMDATGDQPAGPTADTPFGTPGNAIPGLPGSAAIANEAPAAETSANEPEDTASEEPTTESADDSGAEPESSEEE